jgi:outer membrane receptor for ferrienterochelin and colicins
MAKTLFFILTLFSFSCFAQTGQIEGVIVSEHTQLEFATVLLQKTELVATTKTDGKFSFENIPFGKHQLRVSLIGFQDRTLWVVLNESQPIAKLEIELSKSESALDEVVVSGTMKEVSKRESAVPIEVYSSTFFKACPAPSIFESIQNVNGVRPQLNCNVCNTGDIHINGLEGPYTMVLIDGMPIVSGLSTVYGLTGIPQSLIERVEIVKGPASTLYGSEAVGGIINVITKNPDSAPLFSADVMGTSWLELNVDLGVKMQIGNKASTLIGVNYFNFNTPVDNNGDNFTDVPLQNRISIFNKWNFKRKDNKVFTLAGRYLYEDRWGGEMQWSPEFRGGNEIYGESIYTNRWEAIGLYQLPVKEIVNFQFSANGHEQNSVYGTTDFQASQYIGFGQLTWHKEIHQRHQLLSGIALRYTYYDDNTTATSIGDSLNMINAASTTFLPGVFVQDEISINTQNKVLLGLRYDYNQTHGSILSPRVNYKWSSFDQKHIVRMSIGNGYRVANIFTEDHAALTGARTVEFIGEISPETSWNANLNFIKKIFSQNNNYLGIDASVFYTYFDNQIIADYDTDPNKIIYKNLSEYSVSQGVSVNLDAVINGNIKALVGFTAMDVYFTENGEKITPVLTEKFSAVWTLSYAFKKGNFKIDYTGNLYGPMRLPLLGPLDDRDEYSPWWSIQNIQVTKGFRNGFELFGGIKNLLNYTPPANSIARSHDPFDENVTYGQDGQVVPTPENPKALSFDPTYVYAPNQGIRAYVGFRYIIN